MILSLKNRPNDGEKTEVVIDSILCLSGRTIAWLWNLFVKPTYSTWNWFESKMYLKMEALLKIKVVSVEKQCYRKPPTFIIKRHMGSFWSKNS